MKKQEAWIRTYTGGKAYFFEPEKSEINIEDIAHGLSMLCRFNGSTEQFYSVAQHSVAVARGIQRSGGSQEELYAGLMHDAAEAFISDVPSPFKKHFPGFHEAEKRMEKWLAKKFNFTYPYPPSVKTHDVKALVTEMRDLMKIFDGDQFEEQPYFNKITPLNPEESKRLFLAYYNEYRID